MRQLTQKQLDGALSLIASYQKARNDGNYKDAIDDYAKSLMADPNLSCIPEFRSPLPKPNERSGRVEGILSGLRLDGLEIKPDPNGRNGISFDRCSMRRMELSAVTFTDCSFYSADLEGSNLSESHLLECPMSMTSLKRCDLSGMTIECNDGFMNHIDFTMANLESTRLTNLDLRQADFHMANLMEAEFDGCELSFCNMATTNHIHATFKNCTERGNIK